MKNTKWKTLKSKLLFTHPRKEIYEDEVELPSGHKTSYLHYGKGLDAGTVIAVRDNKVLLQREYSYPPDEWLYQFPGGVIEPNESNEAGALRELQEEARLTGTLTQIGWFYVDNRRTADKFYVFLATDVSEYLSAQLDAEEEIEDYWLSVTEVDKLIATGQINNYSALAGWAFFTQTDEYKKLTRA